MLIGAIADDFTGASDLANTLARQGLNVVQTVGVPSGPLQAEAVVIALKSRSIAASAAVKLSLEAADWLLAQGCWQILFKYCSTFDSTPAGNIGPVTEALIDRLGVKSAVLCPAFPTNGRTIYMGHLFVKDRLLSESGMEKHPLTPMTDPDLVRVTRGQATRRVGLVPHPVVRAGAAAIHSAITAAEEAGTPLLVVDAITDADLMAIGEALDGARLVTGGSGIALGLPANFRRAGLTSAQKAPFAAVTGPGVALSGSCSVASRAQVVAYTARHPGLFIDTDALLAGRFTVETALAHVLPRLDHRPMVYSTADPAEVAAAQDRHGRAEVAEAIESFFGDMAVALADRGVTRIVVGGGETSGAVVQALEVEALEIGPEIDPGVPALATLGPRRLGLALKSGNFGAPDFFEKAFAVIAGDHP